MSPFRAWLRADRRLRLFPKNLVSRAPITSRCRYPSAMPRTARAIVANHCYHVINRGNNRARVFHDSGDYAAFLSLMKKAQEHCKLSILAACLMPNHVHFVVRPEEETDVSRWAHWLFTTHVRRYHAKHQTTGRVWQGRFKAFIIQQDDHLVTVIRYVERNPLRAGLVARAEHWPWCSLRWRHTGEDATRLSESPVELPEDWTAFVNTPHTAAEVAAIRTCVNRQRPFGNADWVEEKARELGMTHSLLPLGRPKSPSPRAKRRRPDRTCSKTKNGDIPQS